EGGIASTRTDSSSSSSSGKSSSGDSDDDSDRSSGKSGSSDRSDASGSSDSGDTGSYRSDERGHRGDGSRGGGFSPAGKAAKRKLVCVEEGKDRQKKVCRDGISDRKAAMELGTQHEEVAPTGRSKRARQPSRKAMEQAETEEYQREQVKKHKTSAPSQPVSGTNIMDKLAVDKKAFGLVVKSFTAEDKADKGKGGRVGNGISKGSSRKDDGNRGTKSCSKGKGRK
ncbi:hypothetical protein Agub_g3318, partial [Astrephomene gubernaculifera]